ncbi:PREDICTED: DNA polymerase epsilon subunit 3-like [Branchiostoma belcheri]|uniref:DNA polymerase epsilon subunit 3 n=1 Tax=Branchiostoma belcheri TaxID=7741 RepID=A0A6P4XIH1_BRABE|nr:PREDICTED: DNA polymerase epsilon subunit 3-like [Branchiostoma belcheri]
MAEKIEDLNLPNAVITRIIKDALPEGVNVSKEARSAISRAASVFVLYATSCANNFALKGKRKTLNGTDVIAAVQEMEFEQFLDQLKDSWEAFKKEQKDKKDAAEKRKKTKEGEKAEGSSTGQPSQDEVNTSTEAAGNTDSMEQGEDKDDDQEM